MKLIVQIPCYNESSTLPFVLRSLPHDLQGIDSIEVIIIDDGSTDGTSEIAQACGVTHIIRNTSNLGLAHSFRKGLDKSLHLGADIIVNIDGDYQYSGEDLEKLIQPIIHKQADIVIGDRDTDSIAHFSSPKKLLQRFGSAIVRALSGTNVTDATSGFRAFSRYAALRLTILSNYSYTLESILQAPSKGFVVANVKVRTNPKLRDSRLMSSLREYLAYSTATIIRVFTMYNPLRVFLLSGALSIVLGCFLSGRFLMAYLEGQGSGKMQSLLAAAVFMLGGLIIILGGLVADLIQFNRRLLEDILYRVKTIELDKSGHVPEEQKGTLKRILPKIAHGRD